MQQTLPRVQTSLGLPPNTEQNDEGAHNPASPLVPEQLSNDDKRDDCSGLGATGRRLMKFEKGRAASDEKRLLKIAELMNELSLKSRAWGSILC